MLTSDSEILTTGVAITVSETLAVGREELKNVLVDTTKFSGAELRADTDMLDRVATLDDKGIFILDSICIVVLF